MTPPRVPPRASLPRRVAYHALVAGAPVARTRLGASAWERAWNATVAETTGTTSMRLHGTRVVVNVGTPIRRSSVGPPTTPPSSSSTGRDAHRPVTLVDVGASIGDTVLLVRERCGHELARPGASRATTSRHDARANSVRTPTFTSSMRWRATGPRAPAVRVHAAPPARKVSASSRRPLDQLLAAARIVDVLKIDTDGFDGRVLAGATRLLAAHPAVLFEWHPRLARAADVSLDLAFDVLERAGYRRFMWFDKLGRYSHTEPGTAVSDRRARAEWCLGESTPKPDWHYDVIALPPEDA